MWQLSSLWRGTLATEWCMLREMIIHIFICEFIKFLLNKESPLLLFLESAKKLPKEERSAKMDNIYIIGISATRSTQIWHFTAPHP